MKPMTQETFFKNYEENLAILYDESGETGWLRVHDLAKSAGWFEVARTKEHTMVFVAAMEHRGFLCLQIDGYWCIRRGSK